MRQEKRFRTLPILAAGMVVGGALAGYATFAAADTQSADASAAPTAQMRSADGKMGMGMRGPGHFGPGMGHMGAGKHGVMGTVTAVSGNTITVTGMDGASYTVEAGSAKVERVVTGSLADVQVGDRIGAHGTVSGTTVTASNIMDDVPAPPARPTKATQ